MKTKDKFFIVPRYHPFSTLCMVVVFLLFGVLACSAQTGDYLFSGIEQTITLNPGTYDITAYGAQGGGGYYFNSGGPGAEVEGEFDFATTVNLTLLVGGAGGDGIYYAPTGGYYGGGGGGTGASGGGGSIIDSSAIADLAEVSGSFSPDDGVDGEIIITAVPEPTSLALAGLGGLSLLLFRRQRK
jgi:hypothetical protein